MRLTDTTEYRALTNMVRGSVDTLTSKGSSGWVYAPGREGKVLVHALLNQEIVGDAIANVHRPDLGDIGWGNGDCGFVMQFYREIDPLWLPFVVLTVDGGDTELPCTYLGYFREFFAALYRAHPSAGRSRSLLGGLWTDRTDAAALLSGKVQIGQISRESAAIITQLIHTGFALLEKGDVPLPGGGQVSADMIRHILDGSPMLPVLEAVLEDRPAVIRADVVRGQDMELVQPSAESGLPSPAECLVIVAPFSQSAVEVDVVRESHRCPEFTASGVSRWASAAANAGVEIAADQQSLMDRYEVRSGAVAIIGPGLLYKLRGNTGGGVKLLCAPSRALPMTLAQNGNRRESVHEGRVRIWL